MDRMYGIVVLCLGLAILWQGRSLTIGSFRNPGSGLFPALIAAIMILLSLLLIFFPPKRKEDAREVSARSLLRISAVFVGLLLYALFLETLGFLIVSFVLTTFLFIAFGSQKVSMAIVKSIVFTGLAYLLFEVLLKSNLPKGILGS
jgi:putative tricarboxylic transport membrane protein